MKLRVVKETYPCRVCGSMTTKLLFSDEILNTPICSKKCESDYLRNLTPNAKEQMNVVLYLDERIEKNKRYNRILWQIAGCSLVPFAAGILLANAGLFLIGAVAASVPALLTRHFEETIQKLTRQRKRIVV